MRLRIGKYRSHWLQPLARLEQGLAFGATIQSANRVRIAWITSFIAPVLVRYKFRRLGQAEGIVLGLGR